MRDELLNYYDRELRYIHESGAEFAEKYQGVAASLGLTSEGSTDPHVERMIQSFAFLAARVHLRLDDDFPELTHSLFDIVYPHYIRPVPSMGIVEFRVASAQGRLSTGYPVKRESILYSAPVEGVPCKFQTGWDTTIWPVRVNQLNWTTPQQLERPLKTSGAAAICRLELACDPDIEFAKIGMDSLRFYLNAGSGGGELIYSLYELLNNNCQQIIVRDPDDPKRPAVTLPLECLRPVGFKPEEALLPYPRRSFAGYRLLQEYFAFPQKFLFVELSGLEELAANGFRSRAEILFLISPFDREDRHTALEQNVQANNFKLNCCPIINLFRQTTEGIHLDQTAHEHRVDPDRRRPHTVEVFSIDEVVSSNPQAQEVVRFEPLYSQRHLLDGAPQAYWRASRKPSVKYGGTETWISVVDKSGASARPGVETLTVRCTCTNRDLPALLPFGQGETDFQIHESPLIRGIVVLGKITPTLRPPMGKGQLWSLLSHFSLNYLSLVEEGKEALKTILRLYNFSDSAFVEGQIRGIESLESSPGVARVSSGHGIHFARGVDVSLKLDERQFVGGGTYLFAAVLEYFLGLYVTLNSFSRMTVSTTQRKGELQWPPRAGHRVLL